MQTDSLVVLQEGSRAHSARQLGSMQRQVQCVAAMQSTFVQTYTVWTVDHRLSFALAACCLRQLTLSLNQDDGCNPISR